MKDLYLQLGISQDATPENIEAALKDHPDHSATAVILLDKRRRAAYNRSVSTIRSIGILRDRLGLDKDSSWFQDTCPDFVPKMRVAKFSAKPAAKNPATESTASQAAPAERKQAEPRSGLDWLRPVYIGLAVIVMLALAVYLM
jgi:hypothetical protein